MTETIANKCIFYRELLIPQKIYGIIKKMNMKVEREIHLRIFIVITWPRTNEPGIGEQKRIYK